MKRQIPLIIIGFFCTILSAQTTPVPDVIFEDYLETHAVDGTIVSVGNATADEHNLSILFFHDPVNQLKP